LASGFYPCPAQPQTQALPGGERRVFDIRMPIALFILLLLITAALIGGAFVVGSPVFGVLAALFLLGAWGAVAVLRRTAGREPLAEERDQDIEFTERDRETLLPTADAKEKAAMRRRAEERQERR
jgi:hypothetical protein